MKRRWRVLNRKSATLERPTSYCAFYLVRVRNVMLNSWKQFFFDHYKKYLLVQKYCNVADVSVKSFNRKLEEYKTFVTSVKVKGIRKFKIQWAKLMEHLQAQGYLYEDEVDEEDSSSSDEEDWGLIISSWFAFSRTACAFVFSWQ